MHIGRAAPAELGFLPRPTGIGLDSHELAGRALAPSRFQPPLKGRNLWTCSMPRNRH